MTLVIEDGSLVSSANSYVTVAEYDAWADARFGAARSTAPADTTATEMLILRAMDYFEGLNFIGVKVNRTQELQWPRSDVTIDGYDVESTEIAKEVKNALYELSYAEETSVGQLNQIERKVKSERVGPIDVTYSDGSSSTTITPGVTRALRKLLAVGGNGGSVIQLNRS